MAVHGIGAAARTYFSKPAEKLDLAEAALLAGMIQGPNRLSPVRHPERAAERRDWVLERMEELGWAGPDEVAASRSSSISLRLEPPEAPMAAGFLDWVNSAYTFRFETLGPGAGLFRDKFAIARLKKLGDELVPFGLFEAYARDARVQHIFRMYIVAGLVLRISEAY